VKFHYQIIPERRLILQRLAGPVSLPELRAATERLWADPAYSPDYDGIVDLSGANTAKVSIDDLRVLIDLMLRSRHTSTGRWCAVAAGPLTTACAMIYRQALAARHSLEIFSSWEAASRFLGVDLPPPRDEEPPGAKAT
jgi:hypothetical protein